MCDDNHESLVVDTVPARLHPAIALAIRPSVMNANKEAVNGIPSKGYSDGFPAELEGHISATVYAEALEEINAACRKTTTENAAGMAFACCLCTACTSWCVVCYLEAQYRSFLRRAFAEVNRKYAGTIEFALAAIRKEPPEGGPNVKKWHPLVVFVKSSAPPPPPSGGVYSEPTHGEHLVATVVAAPPPTHSLSGRLSRAASNGAFALAAAAAPIIMARGPAEVELNEQGADAPPVIQGVVVLDLGKTA